MDLELPDLHPNAAALTVFRALPNNVGRSYTISEAPSRRHAIERSVLVARKVGYIAPPEGDCYAVLDVLDGDDEVLQNYAIPTAKAFRWWYRHLHLRVEREG